MSQAVQKQEQIARWIPAYLERLIGRARVRIRPYHVNPAKQPRIDAAATERLFLCIQANPHIRFEVKK